MIRGMRRHFRLHRFQVTQQKGPLLLEDARFALVDGGALGMTHRIFAGDPSRLLVINAGGQALATDAHLLRIALCIGLRPGAVDLQVEACKRAARGCDLTAHDARGRTAR